MAKRQFCIGWLSLAALVTWVGAGDVCAQDASLQKRVAARVPLQELAEQDRAGVQQVLEHPTLFGRGPAEAFAGFPSLYEWMLDHPDRAVQGWRRMGARCTEVTDRGNGHFAWTDGHGSEIHWHLAHSTATQRVWYAQGKVRPGLFLPPISVRFVLLLRYGKRPDGNDRTLIYHQAFAFMLTDSTTAALVTKMLGASAPLMAEQCLGQLELFFSGLVWYLDQHPERTEKLLDKVAGQ